jgi:serine/threonine-protein kinase
MSLPDAERWRRLSPLLDQLLDLPPADRPARLAALQQAHPDLADALAGLLADGGQAQFDRFLTGAVPASAGGAAPGQGSGAGLAGTRLGAYLLEAPLGQGGSGSVWRARREDGRFEGHVAIKLLHLSQLGQAGAERFRREGSILARLAHPHIARLLDAGVAEGGQPYLVIELVQGQRLDRHCDAQQLSVPQRLRLFIDVLQAVAHAHGHLVVHRDIKPSNILVTPDGTVKLLDFGIAKLLDADSAAGPTTDLTRDWGRAMTPEYAAPEQLRGEPVTTATDVYALGVLLYELLSGRLPFPGRRRRAARSR